MFCNVFICLFLCSSRCLLLACFYSFLSFLFHFYLHLFIHCVFTLHHNTTTYLLLFIFIEKLTLHHNTKHAGRLLVVTNVLKYPNHVISELHLYLGASVLPSTQRVQLRATKHTGAGHVAGHMKGTRTPHLQASTSDTVQHRQGHHEAGSGRPSCTPNTCDTHLHA